ncbi:MAG: DUF3037 domain-containing protein [Pirellulaceae bacterium]|nr:DUF3037 domain-containing protein [Pirellulaceae bacterium]
MSRAFYSVVQYCPDRFRAEAVNVGLILLCLDPHDVRVRLTNNLSRVRKLFHASKGDLKNLKLNGYSLVSRVKGSLREILTEHDLANFAASRANDFRLTEPRLAKIKDIDQDFERLFAELVDQQVGIKTTDTTPARVLPPALSDAFDRLSKSKKIWNPPPIVVPLRKRKMEVPYAYRNGVVNLVKPHIFIPGRRAENQAGNMAIDGDLISKNRINGEQHQLIVVSTQEDERQEREISEHIEPLFREYHVRLIRPRDAEAFAKEVEESAH